jgi:tetratricopeptide (TPR) repeat protein
MSETVSVQQLVDEGKTAYEQGDFISAAKAYQAAAESYAASGDELAAAEMRNNSSVAYLQGDDTSAALSVVQGTPEIFEAAGDTRRQGMAYGNLGAVYEAQEQYEDAVDAYSRSADLLGEVGDNDLRLNVMKSLSAVKMREGRHLEALAAMQSGLEDIEKPTPKQSFLKKLLGLPSKYLGGS